MVDTYLEAKRPGMYPPFFTDPEGDSCFSIYQIRWIKNDASLMATISSSETFTNRCAIFLSVHSEYPRIFRVTRAAQNMQKLLSTALVNT